MFGEARCVAVRSVLACSVGTFHGNRSCGRHSCVFEDAERDVFARGKARYGRSCRRSVGRVPSRRVKQTTIVRARRPINAAVVGFTVFCSVPVCFRLVSLGLVSWCLSGFVLVYKPPRGRRGSGFDAGWWHRSGYGQERQGTAGRVPSWRIHHRGRHGCVFEGAWRHALRHGAAG